MNRLIMICILVLLTFPIFSSAEEISDVASSRNFSFSTGLAYQNWSFSNADDPLQQLVFPISISVPIGERISFDLRTFQTNNQYGNDELTGFSDIKFRGKCLLLDNRLLISTGINLPTGKNKLNQQEFIISSITAMPFLKMAVPHLGSGFDLNFSLAAAEKFSFITMGFGIGFQHKGNFEPFSTTPVQYDPGDEFYLELGFETGQQHKLMFDVIFTQFKRDLYDNEEIFKSGNRWRMHLTYQFADWAFIDQKRLVELYLIYRTRSNNEFLTVEGFVPEENRIYGDMGTLGFRGRFPVSPKIAFNLTTQFDIQEIVLDKTYAAVVGGGGVGASFQLNSRFAINLNAEFYRGLMKNGFEAVWFTGWRLLSGLGYSF